MKIIVDGNNLGYMAHYATGDLSSGDMYTGAIFGFLKNLFSVCSRFETNEIVFCFDSRKSYRMMNYKSYKYKRRESMTEEQLESQIRARRQFVTLRREVLPQLGFKNVYIKPGYEADDLIAHFVKKYYHDFGFLILSTDNDLFQLLRSNVFMFSMQTKLKMTLKRFKMEYGLSPKQWALAKAIGGCDGDSVQGIVGAADPAKSANSKAIKYVLGELNSGVIKDRIESEEGKKTIQRNLQLVKLPYRGVKEIKFKLYLKKEKFKRKDWIDVFDKYDFRFFLRDEQFDKITELFGLCR